jgi:D-arginine dehydrogenase
VPSYDTIVIGGGMAGVSIGYELAADRSVALLDMEATLAYHTTGRSAAMFLESYGGPAVRALTVCSRPFLENLGVLSPLPMLCVGGAARGAAVEQRYEQVRTLAPNVELLDGDQARELQPLLRPGAVELAMLEPDATEIDVHALHQHYVRGLRERGGLIHTRSPIRSAQRTGGTWTVRTDDQTWTAPTVVNAAGAWADVVAAIFGAAPVGLRPLRRTAFIADAPPGAGAPMIDEVAETCYIKPEVGRVLCSPADETPQDPSDARPDELEIARAIEAINDLTTLDIRHVRASWAGLRSFVPDRTPVVGYDAEQPGLFWYAGQGGYGIQLAAALARVGAALARGGLVPDDLTALGFTAADVSPRRSSS